MKHPYGTCAYCGRRVRLGVYGYPHAHKSPPGHPNAGYECIPGIYRRAVELEPLEQRQLQEMREATRSLA